MSPAGKKMKQHVKVTDENALASFYLEDTKGCKNEMTAKEFAKYLAENEVELVNIKAQKFSGRLFKAACTSEDFFYETGDGFCISRKGSSDKVGEIYFSSETDESQTAILSFSNRKSRNADVADIFSNEIYFNSSPFPKEKIERLLMMSKYLKRLARHEENFDYVPSVSKLKNGWAKVSRTDKESGSTDSYYLNENCTVKAKDGVFSHIVFGPKPIAPQVTLSPPAPVKFAAPENYIIKQGASKVCIFNRPAEGTPGIDIHLGKDKVVQLDFFEEGIRFSKWQKFSDEDKMQALLLAKNCLCDALFCISDKKMERTIGKISELMKDMQENKRNEEKTEKSKERGKKR